MGTWTTATRTWAAGEVVTAANLNAQLRNFANGFGAWTAYTPTITSGTGTLTSVSATGRYLLVQKLCVVTIAITITTNGTGATDIRATLPTAGSAGTDYYGAGRIASTGGMVALNVNGGVLYIRKYDNTYPGATGAVIKGTVTYEAG